MAELAAAPTPATGPQPPSPTDPSRVAKLLGASAVMAAGTALSRVLGFFRLVLLVFLFGNSTRQADMFSIANTVPNSMYILLAGGVLNTVLVPQIVRAIRSDRDGGEAYTNRIMTAGLIALGLITVALTAAVPLVIRLYSAPGWREPALQPQYASMVILGYYCMPQIFFYGVHVLAGQVLNARDRFGPMMWAPIANNVVSIGVLAVFWAVFDHTDPSQPFTPGQQALLGLGSTLGIAAQATVLVPFLRAAGYRFRPRFDFRHTGLGKTFRLAKWTLGFVLATQVALVVVSQLATGATVDGRGAGLTSYYNAYALWILPHSLITVSLATAMLPAASRLAAADDLPGVAAETMRSLRLAVTGLLPAAVAFLVLGLPLTRLAFGFGRGAGDAAYVGWALMALAVGLVPFTVQYLCLRAFYALEDTRTTFVLQLLISGLNVGLGIVAVLALRDPALVATGLGAAYSLAYLVGMLVSLRTLRRRLPGLDGSELVLHCLRLLFAVLPAAVLAWLICFGFATLSSSRVVLALSLVVAGVVAVAAFAWLAGRMGIREVNEITATLLRRRSRRPLAVTAPQPGLRSDNDVPGRGGSAPAARSGSGTIGAAPAAALPEEPSDEPVVSEPSGPTEDARSMAHAAVASGGMNEPSPAATLPAGTILASRYRLEELLDESEPSVTWRAFDQMLSRSVLVHLLAPGDPEEADLLAAARRASVATDSRFLRVLDAVQSTDPALGSYIVCEYAVGQSLELVLSHGPLSGLEAAWVVREVADAMSGVHSLGLYHRRLNLDTVIVTPAGSLKIVGLLIESTLRPLRTAPVVGADTPELVDVTDLGRLLYACLVSRWPGGPAYGLPAAPQLGRRWMTPRQVRAGVSPTLDQVCDQILGDPPRHRLPALTTAHDVVNALTKVLGVADAAPDLERRLRQPVPQVGAERRGAAQATPVSSLLDQPTEEMYAVRPQTLPAASAPPRTAARTSVGTAAATVTTTGGASNVPREDAPHGGRRHSRRWAVLLIMLALVLVSAGIVSAVALNHRLSGSPRPSAAAPSTGAGPAASSAPPSASPTPPPVTPGAVVPIAGAADFDPQADPPRENPAEVRYAFDGDPTTRWRTVNYYSAKLGNLKRGVGLVFDLGSVQPVSAVQVTVSGKGTDLELRVPQTDPAATSKAPMSSDKRWRVVATQDKATATATLTPAQAVTTRYVLVYLTSLPKEGTGYRGGIYEVQVRQ